MTPTVSNTSGTQGHSWLASLTTQSLVGLGLGLACGLLILGRDLPGSGTVLGGADVLIRAWTNAFRLIVAPLVVSQLYLAIAARRTSTGDLGRLGLAAPAVFLGLLVLTALLSAVVTSVMMTLPLLREVSLPNVAGAPGATIPVGDPADSARWVDGFVPPNLFAAAATDNILPLMLFALAFALAARRLAPELQESLASAFRAIGGAMFVLVDWLLRIVPLVMFALGIQSASRSGLMVGGMMLAFTGVETVGLLLALLMLYPLAVFLGGLPLRRFARALLPAQITAATTRSSLATIPALLKGAEELPFDRASASAVIPLAGAVLKLSRAVSGPVKFLFLAYVLHIPIGLEQIVVFTATIILLSPSTVGVPRVTSGTRSLPAYVAAGIPAEYVVLLGATTAVTDVFMTVLNSTGYMTAAVLVGRFATGRAPAAAPTPAVEATASVTPIGPATAAAREPPR